MATKLQKPRLGVSDDPTALQPSLNDCVEAMLQQAEPLMHEVVRGLELASLPTGAQRVASFSQGPNKLAIEALRRSSAAVAVAFREELTRIVYHGGGKDLQQAEVRFEDLQLFGDAELDQSIEVARAQQEVNHAVDDVLAGLDALISTLLGWRTIQPGLNPLRPEFFVRALQAALARHVPDHAVREALIAPAAGLLGVNLRKLYRELADWLGSTGVEPAVPLGGRVQKGAANQTVNDSIAKTLLTLDKLRKLLAGDFDSHPAGRPEFLLTMPASMSLLQEMKGVDALVQRLEKRPAKPSPAAQAQTLEDRDRILAETPTPRLGQQLGEEVVRLMFDSLASDTRLLAPFRQRLAAMEPAILKLAEADSRFFSDRNHAARQLLDRITQRSLAYASEQDPGWPRFLVTVDEAVGWLGSKVVDSATFGELLDQLQAQWSEHDSVLKQRREEAARALLHAEQRNLLAQKLAAEFEQLLAGLEVADFVADFLKGSWAQVVAEAQLSCADGSDDPYGYRALVEDLIWSVQRSTARRGRARRLIQMIPGLLAKLREGLQRIDYPPELTHRFFDNLITIHRAAVLEGEAPQAQQTAQAAVAAEEAESQPSRLDDSGPDANLWMAQDEVEESGYMDVDSYLPPEAEALIEAEAAHEAATIQTIQQASQQTAQEEPPEAAQEDQPYEPIGAADLKTGAWVELIVDRKWTRMQLTWSSPHGTLFMFTSAAGTAHSMSRRTLERLRADGLIRVVAERNVVDDALDKVAKAAMNNTLGRPPKT